MVARPTPQLVFWEVTKACPLACIHCRASAISQPLPGELTTAQGLALIDQIAAFGRPTPILVMTGGDVLMRRDLDTLVARARQRGVRVALAPAVSPLLREERAIALREAGVRSMSVSLDGMGLVHDQIRGVLGHHAQTVEAVTMLRRLGLSVQVNTVVMRRNLFELPSIAAYLLRAGVKVWEVFFLIEVGRGVSEQALTAAENEDVARFLFRASGYGLVVRTVEAPFYRRVSARLAAGTSHDHGRWPLEDALCRALEREVGSPPGRGRASTSRTRDGAGIIFVAHDGQVFPSGFLPLAVGSVTESSLVDIYHHNPLLRDIQAARFAGPCGTCSDRERCGGSRARAYAMRGDPLASDPGCMRVAVA